MTVDEILEHHGVKGQKWGVRNRSKSSSGTSSKMLKDHSASTRAGQIFTGAMLAAPGFLTLAAIKMGK